MAEDLIEGVMGAANVQNPEEKFANEVLNGDVEPFYETPPSSDPFDGVEPFYTTEQAQSDLYTGDLSAEQLAERAVRYHFSLGDRSPGFEQINYDLMTSKESSMRDHEILNREIEDRKIRGALIDEIMTAKGGAASPEEIDFVRNLASEEVHKAGQTPGTILEKLATEKLFASALANPIDDDYFVDISDLDSVAPQVDKTNTAMQYSLIARRYMENQAALMGERSWSGAITDFAANAIIPFYQWYRMSDAADLGEDTSWLLGNNLKDQVVNMYLLPTAEEFDTKMRETMEKLNSLSPQQAMQFAAAMTNYTASEKFFDNVGTVMDATIVASPAVATLGRLKNTAAGLASGSNSIAAKSLAAAAGNQTIVAQNTLIQRALSLRVSAAGSYQSFVDMTHQVPSLFNPAKFIYDQRGNLSTVADEAARLETVMTANRNNLIQNLVVDPVRIDRLTNEQRAVAFLEAEKKFRTTFQHLNHAIINVNPIRGAEDSITTVDAIAVEIGSTTGKYFGSKQIAQRYAQQYGIPDANVLERNGLYYLQVVHHVDESSLRVLGALRTSTNSQPTGSLLNQAFGWFRTKEDIIPKQLAEDAGVVSVQAKGMLKAARQIRETIEDLPKQGLFDKFWGGKASSREDFEKFIKLQQTDSKFSNSLVELERDWTKSFNRLPTEQEKVAYMAYRQLNDMDWVVRNLNVHRDKTRIGIRDYRLERNGSPIGWFEAKDIGTQVPRMIKDDAGILVWDPITANGPLMYKRLRFLKDSERTTLDAGGYRVLQLSHWGDEALRRDMIAQGLGSDLPSARIHYLLVKDPENKALDFKQVPYAAGGHHIMDDKWVISQPVIRKNQSNKVIEHYWSGDTNLLTSASRLEADDIAAKLDQARLLYRDYLASNKQPLALYNLRQYLKNNLPISFPDFRKEFESKRLDVDTPIMARSANQSTWSAQNLSGMLDPTTGKPRWENLVNDKLNEHNVYQGNVDLSFALERGNTLLSVKNTGSLEDPIYHLKRGDLLDPLSSMDRTVTSLFRGVLMDDLKRKSTQNFVELFQDVLDMDIAEMRRNPLNALVSPKWKTGVAGDARYHLADAKNYRRATLELLGIVPDAQRDAGVVAQRLADSVLGRLGLPRQDVTNKLEWTRTKDPITMLRGVAFDAKLGLLNPRQYLLGALTSIHSIAVEGPVRGSQAVMNAWLMRAARINPSLVRGIGNQAMGMSAQEFEESFNMMRRLQWDDVGKETASLDDLFSGTLVDSAVDRARDAGRFFFKEGDMYARLTAWNAAYMRWRAANPTATFTNEAGRQVLARANLLSVNMISSSNASWQKGLLSIPTQFSTYPIRMMEQLLPGFSDRLTAYEKAQAFLTYSFFFGVPVAASGTVGLWPVHESFKKELMERGYDTDSNLIAKGLNDGMLSFAAELMGGTKLNIPQSLGPSGVPLFSDLLTGEKTFVETMLGATGSVFGEAFKATQPFAWSIASIFKEDDEQYPLTMKDFTSVLDIVSTFSNAHKAIVAFNTGQYIGKNGTLMDDDITGYESFVIGLTGVQPQRLADAFTMMDSDREFRKVQEVARKEIVKNMQMMFKAEDDNEKIAYAKRAKAWYVSGGFRPDQASGILKALGDIKPMVDKAEWEFAKRSPEHLKMYLDRIEKRKENGGVR